MFDILAKLEIKKCTVVIEDSSERIIAVMDQGEYDMDLYTLDNAKEFLINVGVWDEYQEWKEYKTANSENKVFYMEH